MNPEFIRVNIKFMVTVCLCKTPGTHGLHEYLFLLLGGRKIEASFFFQRKCSFQV